MSYIQIDIGGKTRGLKFNQLAIELINQYNDLQSTSAFVYAMIYGGLRGNSYVKREEPDYTFENVCDWVDGLKDKANIISQISKAMTETELWKELTNNSEEKKEEEKEGKKKA